MKIITCIFAFLIIAPTFSNYFKLVYLNKTCGTKFYRAKEIKTDTCFVVDEDSSKKYECDPQTGALKIYSYRDSVCGSVYSTFTGSATEKCSFYNNEPNWGLVEYCNRPPILDDPLLKKTGFYFNKWCNSTEAGFIYTPEQKEDECLNSWLDRTRFVKSNCSTVGTETKKQISYFRYVPRFNCSIDEIPYLTKTQVVGECDKDYISGEYMKITKDDCEFKEEGENASKAIKNLSILVLTFLFIFL